MQPCRGVPGLAGGVLARRGGVARTGRGVDRRESRNARAGGRRQGDGGGRRKPKRSNEVESNPNVTRTAPNNETNPKFRMTKSVIAGVTP